ncbi:MAG TPA: lantibiotic dehydratase C-terminal domain-containing protein [Thermoanaerobaculia bacterium]|nr:lantibiotic dehydratase C-terminal domain-containing protein [Thermoanaerobaculia bacterium]
MQREDFRPSWCSFHIFYHSDQQRLLGSLIAPSVMHFFQTGQIERFFFIRYSLGGPHIRLRLQCRCDRVEEIEIYLRHRAEEFFERWPSKATIPVTRIQEQNAAILAQAPLETDDRVYPDQHLERFEFHPEVERYGGPDRLEDSLDLFEVSSIEALQMSIKCEGYSRPQQLSFIFRMILNQALGFSDSHEDLQRWNTYYFKIWPSIATIDQAADRVFEKQEAQLRALFSLELERPSFPYLQLASRRLADLIRDAEEMVRERILQSQLHMTANRVGLTNHEELYVCRLLQRAGTGQPADPTGNHIDSENHTIETLRRIALDRLSAQVLPSRKP